MTRWTPWSLGYAKGSSDWLVAASWAYVSHQCGGNVRAGGLLGVRLPPMRRKRAGRRPLGMVPTKAAETYPQPVLTKPARKLNLDWARLSVGWRSMLVLHGWWADGLDGEAGLAVWAEDSSQTASKLRTATRQTGRRRNRPVPPPADEHPWAVDHSVLETLGGLSPAVHEFVEIVLPTAGDAPLASPELISDEIAPTPRVEVRQWRVPIVILEPQLALTVLQSPLPDECAGGADWRILAEVASFADDLAARGRILPAIDVVQSDGGPIGRSEGRAWWRPLVTGPDAVWVRALALALPPAALGTTNGDHAKTRPADTVAHALGALTDAAARQRLQRRNQSAPRGSRQPRPARYPGAVREWLGALVDDPWFEASTATLANLESDLEAWQCDAAGGVARARFRLTEPH
jgi:hypothetical protein